jgi:hypothetical protein
MRAGSIPASLAGHHPERCRREQSVYTSDGQTLLFRYTTNAPLTVTGTVMNTGNVPFEQGPVYISESPSGLGTTTFDT